MIGKLPGHGDFVARGVGSGERQQIDEWLAASMAAAREELGGKFEAAFDIAPPWRFAWRDTRWTAGALVPSIDSAGRRFPLLVAVADLAEEEVRPAAEICENAASEAIAKGWSADELLQAINTSDIASEDSPVHAGWWNDELGNAGTSVGDRLPAAILSHMLASVTGAAA